MMISTRLPARRRPGGRRVLCMLGLLAALVALPAWAAPPGPDASPPTVAASSPDPMWTDLGDADSAKSVAPTNREVLPTVYRLVGLDYEALTTRLAQAPSSQATKARDGLIITLPMPDGTHQRFAVVETDLMSREVRQYVPDKRTYTAQGLDDPAAVINLDTGHFGLRAYGRTSQGTLWIDPWSLGEKGRVISAWKRDFARPADVFKCGVGGDEPSFSLDAPKTVPQSGDQMHTFRLAVTLTGEYVTFFGGQTPAVDASVTTINRVNSVYQIDLASQFAYNYVVPYTDPATDPFPTGTAVNGNMLNQNQSVLDNLVGSANYDIGHIFTQAGGGLAGLGVVCVAGNKGRGGTGLSNPTGDVFDIDYVSHEIGHQMGGSHTFNGSTGSCGGGNRSAANAYEPGSGSTIMAYAGICGAESVQSNSDPYFHVRSLEQIIATRNAASCAIVSPTGNTPPTIDAGPDHTIPQGTTFYLTAEGNDLDGDALTYNFEQYDLGAASPPTDPFGPLFRSYGPNGGNYRYFGDNGAFEVLPTVDRNLTFRAIVRDNAAGGGGVADDEIVLTVSGAPFAVTFPAGGESFVAGQPVTVTWDVGGSVAADVKIYLTYAGNFVLLAGLTPNDGSEQVVLPCGITSADCGIWVEEVMPTVAGVHVFDQSTGVFTLTDSQPDYVQYATPGWPSSVLANSTDTAVLPTSLPGDQNTFFWWSFANLGSSWACDELVGNFYRDDVLLGTYTDPSGPAPLTGISLGAYQQTISGGRHTIWQELDPAGQVAESDEGNNLFGRQWVWQPALLALELVVARPEPPARLAGSAAIPGGTTFYQNQDGLFLDAVGTGWQAVAVGALNGSDYDVFLYDASLDLDTGFETSLTGSAFGGSSTDFVLVNRNVVAPAPYDVGLLRFNGSGDYLADRRYSDAALPLGTALPAVAVADLQLVDIQEIVVGPGEEGRNVIEIENVSTAQACDVLLFDATLGLGSRGSALVSTAVGADGRAVIDYDFTASGRYAVVLVRRAADGPAPFTYDLRWRPTPPDIATAVLPGSYGPLVPTFDFSTPIGDPLPAPVSLPGDVLETILRFDVANNGPADADLWDLQALRDGDVIGSIEWPFGLPGGSTAITSQGYGPFLYPGGRHTAGIFFDSLDEFDELDEENNRTAEQFVWQPAQLALETTAVRNASPEPIGGWDDIPVGLIREFNADGLRTPVYQSVGDNGFVGGWAATPTSGNDVDLRVHPASTGALDGFETVLETAAQAGGGTEIVLFDLDGVLPGGTSYDIGAQNAGGSGAYQAHATESQFLPYNPLGVSVQNFGPFALAGGEILGLFEFSTFDGAGGDVPLLIMLENNGGDADLGLVIFGRTDGSGFYTLPDAYPDGFADGNGPGGGEDVLVNFPPDAYWMVAVYKTDGGELAKTADYSLRFVHQTALDVPAGAPLVADITNHPNPFNPQTKLSFTMEKPGRAKVRVYDVQGRLVRTVVDGDLSAGRHERNWRGVDDAGNTVASGVYLALFEYPGGAVSQRMVLLK